MHLGTGRMAKLLGLLTCGMVFQATAPIGCAGALQQNLEVLYALNSIAGTSELYQSLIWKLFGRLRHDQLLQTLPASGPAKWGRNA